MRAPVARTMSDHHNHHQQQPHTGRPQQVEKAIFVAASLYEFKLPSPRREAGFPYLNYVQGEIFDVSYSLPMAGCVYPVGGEAVMGICADQSYRSSESKVKSGSLEIRMIPSVKSVGFGVSIFRKLRITKWLAASLVAC